MMVYIEALDGWPRYNGQWGRYHKDFSGYEVLTMMDGKQLRVLPSDKYRFLTQNEIRTLKLKRVLHEKIER